MADKPLVEEKKPPNPKVKLVYIGPCTTSDKRLGGMFLPITDEQLREKRLPDELPQERVYGGKVPKLVGCPGTIYQFEHKPENETTIFGDTRRYVGFLDNDPRVVEWQANHDAFFATEELKRQEKKGKNKNLIQRRLAPLKVAYNKMVGHQRAAFLAQIIGYITGRVSKDCVGPKAMATKKTDTVSASVSNTSLTQGKEYGTDHSLRTHQQDTFH